MSKRNRFSKISAIPPGFASKQSYVMSQSGGCPNFGMYQSGPQLGGSAQSGGAILPAIAAVYAGLKAVQPFSKAKKALEDNVGDSGKKSTGYNIAHKIAAVGSSLGFGDTSNLDMMAYKKTTKHKSKQKGTGRKKHRKHKK